jgi:ubiquinone/menaquinone biosynthesis C-methylase UbiE
MPALEIDRREAARQWTNDPCEFHFAEGLEPGTPAFYDRVENRRYREHPWMQATMDFDAFAGQDLLEIGFGMGTDLMQFARGGANVSGIDLSPAHLEITSRRFELAGYPANLRLADAESMPFDDQSFDAVYSFGVIHHTDRPQRALDEIHRILRPGGRAILAVYHRHSAFFWGSIVLTSYLYQRRFLRESFRRTISRIEHREQSDACPRVRVYSRRQFRGMLRNFRHVELSCRHLDRSQFGVLRHFVSDERATRLEPRLGWYLIAKCTK